MPASSPQTGSKQRMVRFGVFEADLCARELRKQGRRLRLQDQPFAVLALLLDRAGDVVTREELREKLWPADTFVDFDHSLNTAVNKIREVLSDSASSPRFVETLARRGYRFIADVQPETASVAKVPSPFPTWAGAVGVVNPHRGIIRSLFALIQIMYLIFYVAALLRWQDVARISWQDTGTPLVMIAVLVTAGIGIPVRCYLLSAVSFDYVRLGDKFQKIFLGVLVLDQVWAAAPFLMLERISFGPAFGATAALLYVPFAERTLVRMAYPVELSNKK